MYISLLAFLTIILQYQVHLFEIGINTLVIDPSNSKDYFQIFCDVRNITSTNFDIRRLHSEYQLMNKFLISYIVVDLSVFPSGFVKKALDNQSKTVLM